VTGFASSHRISKRISLLVFVPHNDRQAANGFKLTRALLLVMGTGMARSADVGMGPGDPVPVVIELGKPLRDGDFRSCFVLLANALGLRYNLVEHPGFSYNDPFNASITETMQVLQSVGILRSDYLLP
jgi:hypothetical protein